MSYVKVPNRPILYVISVCPYNYYLKDELIYLLKFPLLKLIGNVTVKKIICGRNYGDNLSKIKSRTVAHCF